MGLSPRDELQRLEVRLQTLSAPNHINLLWKLSTDLKQKPENTNSRNMIENTDLRNPAVSEISLRFLSHLSHTETPHLAQDLEDRSVVVGDTVALQCKALGSPPPRITWLHNDQPLHPSERHHFTPGNQLLVIGSASLEDAGRYTCLMSNTLGTERAHSQLVVTQRRSTCYLPSGPSTVTIGIIVIAVVTSIVITSLVWVCIIYQTRKKSEECSVTNTGEFLSILF